MVRTTLKSGTTRRWACPHAARSLGAFATVCLLASGAGADDPGLVRIDQFIDDRDPLAVSLRQLQPDFRQDLGFEHLYVDAADPTKYVRVSGALYAVSPRTDYVALRSGVFPAVAAGTVFYIGGLPQDLMPVAPMAPDPNGLSVDVSTPLNHPVVWSRPIGTAPVAAPLRRGEPIRATPVSETPPAPGTTVEPLLVRDMSDPSYRVARLRQIARMLGASR